MKRAPHYAYGLRSRSATSPASPQRTTHDAAHTRSALLAAALAGDSEAAAAAYPIWRLNVALDPSYVVKPKESS
jgi:hypothetical protein